MNRPHPPDSGLSFHNGRVKVDLHMRRVTEGGQAVALGGRSLDLLLALVERRGRVASVDELLQSVWPGQVVEANNLQVQVNSLRKLFGAQAVTTVRGRGYQWVLAPDLPAAQALIGRDNLLAQALAGLQQATTRVVTLRGPGGVGKTRLAQALVQAAGPFFADGCTTVMLAPLRDPTLLVDAISQARGLQSQGGATPLAVLQAHLGELELLLWLDNVEQLAPGLPVLVDLLAAAPRLKIVLTSRVALGFTLTLAGEREVWVPPLAVPGDDMAVDAALLTPALQLLLRRAHEIGHDLLADGAGPRPPNQTAELEAAAELCRRLDGVPLALELAAARLRSLSARALLALLARLERPLDVLGAGSDTPPARQRSLRDTLAWSCSLLSPGAQQLLRGLAVFSGGCTLEAAVAVAGGGNTAATLDRLDELLAHSLLAREDTADGEPRYTLLETIREYAQEEAQRALEFTTLQQRHLQHHLMLAERLLPAWCGATRKQALGVLAGETANLRAALQWVVRTRPDPASAMRLAAALTWWWYFTGQLLEGRQWLTEALALPGAELHPIEQARVGSSIGKLALYLGDLVSAAAQAARAAEIAAQMGDRETLAWALYHQAIPLIAKSIEDSLRCFDQARDLFRTLGDVWAEALTIVYSGIPLAIRPGQETQAEVRLRDGQRRMQDLGDDWGATVADQYLSIIALRRGDQAAAQAHVGEVMRVAQALNDGYRMAGLQHHLARVAIAAGRWQDARSLLYEAAALNHRQGRFGYANALLQQCARVAMKLGDDRRAARLFGAATVDRGPLIMQLIQPDEAAACAAARDALRERLGAAGLEALAAEGRRWTLAQAVAQAAPRPANELA